MLSRGESLPGGADGPNMGKDKPIRTTSFDTATLYSKQGSITTTNGIQILFIISMKKLEIVY